MSLPDRLGKAWECTETLENSLLSRCCCAEADGAVCLGVQDPLACVTPALEVT